MSRASAVSDDLLVKLMKQGLGVKLIQKRVGVGLSVQRLQRLRRENNIPLVQKHSPPLPDEELEKLLREGHNRRTINALLGRDVAAARIKKVRDRLGLPTQKKAGVVPEEELRSMIVQGLSLEVIRERTGIIVCHHRFARIRNSFGIAAQWQTSAHEERKKGRDLLRAIYRALRHVTDTTIRDDAASEMYLAVIQGNLLPENFAAEARRYSGVEVGRWQSRFGNISLDEVSAETEMSLAERIEDPSALEAFDAIFENEDEDA